MESWSNEGEKHTNPRVHYWRMCFRHFVLICYNAGTRPSELVGKLEKRRQIQRDGTARIVQEISGLRWEEVEVYEATHLSKTGKPFQVNEATIHIRKTKTGEPREVPCNTGDFFIRWRKYVEWRAENGFEPVTPEITSSSTRTRTALTHPNGQRPGMTCRPVGIKAVAHSF